jgi:hypothetical protein
LKKTDDDLLNAANHKTLRVKDGFAFALWRQPANGLRYPRVGGVWIRSEGGKKPEARKMPVNRADSHTSGARFVGLRFWKALIFYLQPK